MSTQAVNDTLKYLFKKAAVRHQLEHSCNYKNILKTKASVPKASDLISLIKNRYLKIK